MVTVVRDKTRGWGREGREKGRTGLRVVMTEVVVLDVVAVVGRLGVGLEGG